MLILRVLPVLIALSCALAVRPALAEGAGTGEARPAAAPMSPPTSPLASPLASLTGRRVALVIGNGQYRTVDRLPNPPNDAKLIAETLRELGFTLVGGGARIDLDRAALSDAVRDFGRALSGADVGLFYYAGHGLQVQGVNWLVPVDANPASARDLEFQMVDAGMVLRQMDGVGTKLNIVLLDACRNNPFATRGLRAMQAGLAEMRAPEGTLVSYATQPGNVAADGGGANSPYTRALATSMRQPGLDIFRLFNQVGLRVKKDTGGTQQPWVSTSPIDGDFYFTMPEKPATPPATPPAPPPLSGPDRPTAAAPPAVSGSSSPGAASTATPPPATPPAGTLALADTPVTPVRPPPDPAAAIKSIARAQPCAVLDAVPDGGREKGRVKLRGLAREGEDWEDFLARARLTQQGQDQAMLATSEVTFLPVHACALAATFGAAVLDTRARAEGGLLGHETPRVVYTPPGGGRQAKAALSLALRRTMDRPLSLDVFQPDGSVQHLTLVSRRPEGGGERVTAAFPRPPVAGTHVLTVMTRPAGGGAAVEATEGWLASTRAAPPRGTGVDLAVFGWRPPLVEDTPPPAASPVIAPVLTARPVTSRPMVARPMVARPAPAVQVARRPAGRPPRCGAILERAQLGEPMSEGDRAFLRGACR